MSLVREPDTLSFIAISEAVASRSPQDVAADENFWARISAWFGRPADFVHLEYGYYHPVSRPVLAAEIEMLRTLSVRASQFKRTESRILQEQARTNLAGIAGAAPDEVAILRNATEAMNILIQGVPLSPGDEIVHANQDYGSMVEALEQKAAREGVRLRTVTLPPPDASDDEIVQCFARAITPRTRLLHVTHVIHFTGRILPVLKLSRLAHQAGAEIIVDAAHSFAHLDFKIPALECDYLGASLHKWLAAPLGLGLLYCRRDKIQKLRPLLADTRLASDDIRKLEHVGNRPDSAFAGLLEAIHFHRAIGAAHKHARLHRLQRRWTDALENERGIQLLTPRNPAQHGAIGSFLLDGADPTKIASYLMEKHRVFVAAMDHPVVGGVRATPYLGTLEADVDLLVQAVRSATAHFPAANRIKADIRS